VGWLSFLICVIPLYLLYNTGHRLLWILALGNAIANLWSSGVMHNYAVESSAERIKGLQRNLALEGKLDSEKQHQLDGLKLTVNLNAAPNWLSKVNIVSLVIGLAFCVYGTWLLF
jgi:hypothetical protein